MSTTAMEWEELQRGDKGLGLETQMRLELLVFFFFFSF
jgi:hypothetical protein